ncbi:hypothetical protein ACFV9C_41025 [Kribbella sp. NPDC059898]|uniref:hypothetical protein n=1 Tax=Kribbella sp. NPDC059898 TaxID=3346995 RepID=UPI00365DD110
MIFPVGHGAGPRSVGEYVVRVGGTAEVLSEPEFAVWVRAHQSDYTDQQHVDELLRRGLLVQVDDVNVFAQQYRLLPLYIGLGNRPDDPQQFAIGLPGLEPLAVVPATTYELWQWGWVAPSLWAHCEVLGTTQLEAVLDGVAELLADFVAVLDPVS